MYPEYEKVKTFLDEAELLLSTSKRMEDIFLLTTKRNEKKIAVSYYNAKGKLRKYKYSLFRKHTFELASIISQFMCQKEKNVPIVLKLANGPHWGEIFWATLMAGYKPLLMDAKTTKAGTQNLIDQSHAVAIITEDPNEYSVTKLSLEDMLSEKGHYSFSPCWEDEVIFCSSGTTGDVKLMIFNGENMVHQICASLEMSKTTKDLMYPVKMGKINILAAIPFHHIFGFVAVFLWFTYYGKTLVFPRSLAPSDVQEICQKVGVTHVFSVPLFWDSLVKAVERKSALETPAKQDLLDKLVGYNTGKINKEDAGKASMPIVKNAVQKNLLGSKIRYCISGGGYLNDNTTTMINGIGYPLYNGFGMTEIGVTSVELSPEVEQRLKCSIGKPFHGIEYKIRNAKKDGSGELCVKSKIVHIREIIGGEEKQTELDNEGYFATGDIASVDAQGNYFLKGRIKDIIINADGENIFPDELEIFFRNIPHVTNLSVLGIEKNKSTHEQEIAIVLEVNNQIQDDELKSLIEEVKEISNHLPKGAKISKIYLSRGKLPIANNMKVKRFVIKKAIENNSNEYISTDAKKEKKAFKGFDQKTIDEILLPMRDIFSKVLILPKFKIDDDAHWVNDLGGDSMNYVELIKTVQERFEVIIPEELYGQLACLNDFVEEVAKLKKKGK